MKQTRIQMNLQRGLMALWEEYLAVTGRDPDHAAVTTFLTMLRETVAWLDDELTRES
jgi:hypothetical protein